mgnify:FL=1
MSRYICVDIGGTSIKHGVLNENAIIEESNQTKTEAWLGGAEVLDKVKAIGKQYMEQYENIEGICISTAGMVDPEEGKIVFAGELMPDYTGTCIKKELEKTLGIPCEVENDVNCAGLAEYISGAAKESHIMFCATVGTGIGGCAIVDGSVFHGASNSACEIGYIPMEDSDFQTLGASSILIKKVAGKKRESLDMWDGKKIFELAEKGDEVCISAIKEMCDVLGKGLATICYVLNPDTIVLGGGVMAQKKILENEIIDSLKRYLKPILAEHLQVCFAEYGNEAGMVGALYNFQNKCGRK